MAEEALEQVAPDHATAVVVLTHDEKFDVPALKGALETEAFYVGALGSRRNQAKRRERLLEAGVDEAELDRISGPAGLDIGADTPAETALSILAEILAPPARRLKPGRIRVEAEGPRRTAPVSRRRLRRRCRVAGSPAPRPRVPRRPASRAAC